MHKSRVSLHLLWLCFIPVFSVSLSIFAACLNPISGLNLTWSGEYAITRTASSPNSPAVGTKITAISSPEGNIKLQASDFVSHPNSEFKNYDHYWQFLKRQHQLYESLQSSTVHLIEPNGKIIAISPNQSRSLYTLPVHFWQKLTAGICAWVLGASVFYFGPSSASRRYLFLCSSALFTSCLTSAVYCSREVAMSAPLLVVLCDLDFIGDLLLSLSLICILLHFPKRIGNHYLDIALFCLTLAWFVGIESGVLNTLNNRQVTVPLSILIVAMLTLWQHYQSTHDAIRKSTTFLFLTFIGSAYLFALNALYDSNNKLDALLSIDYTVSLLWILLGLALGISRYKLNIITRHRPMLFIQVSTLSFALISINYRLQYSDWPPYSAPSSLLLLLFLNLAIYHASSSRIALPQANDALHSLFTSNYQARDNEIDNIWQKFITRFFQVSSIQQRSARNSQAVISYSGKFLDIPYIKSPGSLRCEYALQGRRLFNSGDVQIINTLLPIVHNLANASQQRQLEEQRRNKQFAKDLQHNIGETLLPALHHNSADTIKEIIRNVLAETQTISSGLHDHRITLQELLAELEHELEQRLERLNITLKWTVLPPICTAQLVYPVYKTLSTTLRELVKLSSQTPQLNNLCIDISCDASNLLISIRGHHKGVYLPLINLIESDKLRSIIAPLQGNIHIGEMQKVYIVFAYSLPLVIHKSPAG